MAKKKTNGYSHEDLTIAGRAVRIVRTGDVERLLIDGRPCKFRKTDAGYVLHANVYAEPLASLFDAAKLYLDRPDD
jgi:hypothetical protein